MSNAELKSILQRIADKDNSAFDDLYKGYSKVIFGIALSLLKNEENCNDIVQLVMSKLYTMSKESFPTSHELTWLYTVTKNEALQFLRKEQSYIPLDNILDMVSGTDDFSHVVDMETYRAMIKSLDEQTKAIVTLKVVAGFSHREIGKLLHMPTGTVQWKYHTAVHKLRIALANFALSILFGYKGITYFIDRFTPKGGIIGSPLPQTIKDFVFADYVHIGLCALALSTIIIAASFLIKSFFKTPTKTSVKRI